MEPTAHTRRLMWRDLGWLTLLLASLFTFLLGHRPLANPDEGRYVEIPREMLEGGDFITPHLNGLPYFEKPPLFYWVESFLVAQFGVDNPFFLRLSTALFALLGCLSLYLFASHVLGRKVGLWSAVILATNILYFLLARLLILDLVFTVFMTMALLSFWQVAHAKHSAVRWWAIAYGASLAGGVLTKGLIGVVLPGTIILAWIAWTRRFSLASRAFHPLSLLTFALFAFPWHIAVSLRNPEFPYFYFIQEHFLRYTTKLHHRHQPFWFFAPVLLLGFFPWVSFLPRSLKSLWDHQKALPPHLFSFLVLWAGVVFCFFSFSSSKLIPYILPLFPPLALLVGVSIVREPHETLKHFWVYGSLTFLLSLGVLLYIPLDMYFLQAQYDVLFLLPAVLLAVAFLWCGIGGGLFYRRSAPQKALFAIALSTFCFLLTAAYLDRWLQPRPSSYAFAQILKPMITPQTPVIVCGFYPQDLPIYLKRTIQVFGYPSELDFGASIRPQQDRILTQPTFETIWKSPAPAYVILPYRGRDPMEWHTYMQNLFPHLSFSILNIHPPYLLCSNQSGKAL